MIILVVQRKFCWQTLAGYLLKTEVLGTLSDALYHKQKETCSTPLQFFLSTVSQGSSYITLVTVEQIGD